MSPKSYSKFLFFSTKLNHKIRISIQVYSFPHTHKDGRVSYPMVFIFSSPPGGSVELNMMYAGSKINLVREAGMTKIVELRDLEELTDDYLR